MRKRSLAAALAAAALAAAALVGSGAGSAAASTASGGPVGQPDASAQGSITNVAASATWGIRDGKPFFKVTKGKLVGTYKLRATSSGGITPDAGVCTETIDNVSYAPDNKFHWHTEQICSGNFGSQNMSTQMWRSSWSGPRGYGGWAHSALTTYYYISVYWSIACNLSGGQYTYYPVMYGFASGIGNGPTIRSANSLTKYCGTSPP